MFAALGRFGVWRSGALLSPELAVTLGRLGYGRLWVGGSPAGDRYPGRFLLGIGVGHPEAVGDRYTTLYKAPVQYLDGLEAAQVPVQRRVLAALGPKMLRLSAQRAAGAHPYLVTVEHTRWARTIPGSGVLLAPEQKVVLDADPLRARSIGRRAVAKPYVDRVRIVGGTANPALARAVAARLGTQLVFGQLERFPDGELRPIVGRVRGGDVYVVQPTGPPVNDNLVELLLLLDACCRAGADRVTAVVPYFGYARQDRRGRAGEPIGARVVADMIAAAGADRLLVVDPYTSLLEAMFSVPVEMLAAVPTLAATVESMIGDGAVVVAPDLGALRLVRHFASLVSAPFAVVDKHRVSGTTVRAEELLGDVRGRPVVLVDDMISTGATIEAAARVLQAHGATPGLVVAASHGLFVGPAAQRLGQSGRRRLVVTDSLVPREELSDPQLGLPLQTESIAGLLAETIDRLHRSEPLDELVLPS